MDNQNPLNTLPEEWEEKKWKESQMKQISTHISISFFLLIINYSESERRGKREGTEREPHRRRRKRKIQIKIIETNELKV